MYVLFHLLIYLHIYLFKYSYVYLSIYSLIYLLVCVCVCIHECVCVCASVDMWECEFLSMCACVCPCASVEGHIRLLAERRHRQPPNAPRPSVSFDHTSGLLQDFPSSFLFLLALTNEDRTTSETTGTRDDWWLDLVLFPMAWLFFFTLRSSLSLSSLSPIPHGSLWPLTTSSHLYISLSLHPNPIISRPYPNHPHFLPIISLILTLMNSLSPSLLLHPCWPFAFTHILPLF